MKKILGLLGHPSTSLATDANQPPKKASRSSHNTSSAPALKSEAGFRRETGIVRRHVIEPIRVGLDDSRAQLVLHLLSTLISQLAAELEAGRNPASSMSSSTMLSPAEEFARDSVSALILDGSPDLAVKGNGGDLEAVCSAAPLCVNWWALIQVLSYRLPLISPAQLTMLSSMFTKYTSSTADTSWQTIVDGKTIHVACVQMLLGIPAHYRQILAALCAVLQLICAQDGVAGGVAVDMLLPALFPSIFLQANRDEKYVKNSDDVSPVGMDKHSQPINDDDRDKRGHRSSSNRKARRAMRLAFIHSRELLVAIAETVIMHSVLREYYVAFIRQAITANEESYRIIAITKAMLEQTDFMKGNSLSNLRSCLCPNSMTFNNSKRQSQESSCVDDVSGIPESGDLSSRPSSGPASLAIQHLMTGPALNASNSPKREHGRNNRDFGARQGSREGNVADGVDAVDPFGVSIDGITKIKRVAGLKHSGSPQKSRSDSADTTSLSFAAGSKSAATRLSQDAAHLEYKELFASRMSSAAERHQDGLLEQRVIRTGAITAQSSSIQLADTNANETAGHSCTEYLLPLAALLDYFKKCLTVQNESMETERILGLSVEACAHTSSLVRYIMWSAEEAALARRLVRHGGGNSSISWGTVVALARTDYICPVEEQDNQKKTPDEENSPEECMQPSSREDRMVRTMRNRKAVSFDQSVSILVSPDSDTTANASNAEARLLVNKSAAVSPLSEPQVRPSAADSRTPSNPSIHHFLTQSLRLPSEQAASITPSAQLNLRVTTVEPPGSSSPGSPLDLPEPLVMRALEGGFTVIRPPAVPLVMIHKAISSAPLVVATAPTAHDHTVRSSTSVVGSSLARAQAAQLDTLDLSDSDEGSDASIHAAAIERDAKPQTIDAYAESLPSESSNTLNSSVDGSDDTEPGEHSLGSSSAKSYDSAALAQYYSTDYDQTEFDVEEDDYIHPAIETHRNRQDPVPSSHEGIQMYTEPLVHSTDILVEEECRLAPVRAGASLHQLEGAGTGKGTALPPASAMSARKLKRQQRNERDDRDAGPEETATTVAGSSAWQQMRLQFEDGTDELEHEELGAQGDPEEDSDDILALPGFTFSTPVVAPPNRQDLPSFKGPDSLWTGDPLSGKALTSAQSSEISYSIRSPDTILAEQAPGSYTSDHAERLRAALAVSRDILTRHRERLQIRKGAVQERA